MDSVTFQKYLKDNYYSNAPEQPWTFVVKKKLSAEAMQEQPDERPSEEDEMPTYSRRELQDWAMANGMRGNASSAAILEAMQQSEIMSDEEDTTVDTSREPGDVYLYLEFDITQELKMDVMDTPVTITANKSTRGKENSVEVPRGIQVGDTPTIQVIVDTLARGDRREANVVLNKTWFYERSWINYFLRQWLYTKKKTTGTEDDVSGDLNDFNTWFDRVIESNVTSRLKNSTVTTEDVEQLTDQVQVWMDSQDYGNIKAFIRRLKTLGKYQDKISTMCNLGRLGTCSKDELEIIEQIKLFITDYIEYRYYNVKGADELIRNMEENNEDREEIESVRKMQEDKAVEAIPRMEEDIEKKLKPKIKWLCKWFNYCDSNETLVKRVIKIMKSEMPRLMELVDDNRIKREIENLQLGDVARNATRDFRCHPLVIYDLQQEDSFVARMMGMNNMDAFAILFSDSRDQRITDDMWAVYYTTLCDYNEEHLDLEEIDVEDIRRRYISNVRYFVVAHLQSEYVKRNLPLARELIDVFTWITSGEPRQQGMDSLYAFIYVEERIYKNSWKGMIMRYNPVYYFKVTRVRLAKFEEFKNRYASGIYQRYRKRFAQRCINRFINGETSMLDIFNEEIRTINPGALPVE